MLLPGTFMPVVSGVRVLMKWFIEEGASTTAIRRPCKEVLLFKADAKGEPGRFVLGGFKVQGKERYTEAMVFFGGVARSGTLALRRQ